MPREAPRAQGSSGFERRLGAWGRSWPGPCFGPCFRLGETGSARGERFTEDQPRSRSAHRGTVQDSSNSQEPTDTRPEIVDELIVPVVAQELDVKKRTVESGRVRITKQVHERVESVEEPLASERVVVERVAVNQVVTEPPATRQEGDTLIVPVVEEVLFVEKRLVLKEELRITRIRSVEMSPPERVALRSEDVRVERMPPRDRDGE
ncbi:YsnF/AvaK domain-containing protein [Sorangium sp. So ce1078]|uniref:YsnF/AvaK domain-containing protein n=1 Tax=Sorangium sp. So ce1078 TaxID=3133329 RepID=UPI003F5FBADB